MSVYTLILIPRNPYFAPLRESVNIAIEKLGKIVPNGPEIEVKLHDDIRFFTCGTNFEVPRCPHCGKELLLNYWKSWMDDDWNQSGRESFSLSVLNMGCCNKPTSLNDLVYDSFDQGFTRFSISITCPGSPCLEQDDSDKLGGILECDLRQIFQRI